MDYAASFGLETRGSTYRFEGESPTAAIFDGRSFVFRTSQYDVSEGV
jgi:hypothetical protein